jgi:adenylate cyclase
MKRIGITYLILIAVFALSYAALRSLEIKFVVNDWMLPIPAFVGAGLLTGLALGICVAWQLQVERKKRERIMIMFGQSVSPAMVAHLVKSGESPKLGAHETVITPFFSDIQSFTLPSESLTADRLVELVQEYLTACTDIIQAEGGTLDKYVGNAIIAMFGAPSATSDHAFRACVAAQRVQLKLDDLRAKWRREGARWPASLSGLRARIGLNTGSCIVGNLGSRTRFNYTMMGHHVNLAARMESGAANWGVYSMCTEATRAACVQHGGDRVVFRPLGRIAVAGHSPAVPIHEIVGLKEAIEASTRECVGLFEQGLTRYYARDWEGAIQQFEQSARLEPLIPDRSPGVKTNPSLVYLGMCQHFKAQPPPEKWDGGFVHRVG